MSNTQTNNTTATSEVGSLPMAEISAEQLKTILDQNRSMMELIKNLQGNPVKTVTSVTLPKINPDKADADVASWCATEDIIQSETATDVSALVMALSKAKCGEFQSIAIIPL